MPAIDNDVLAASIDTAVEALLVVRVGLGLDDSGVDTPTDAIDAALRADTPYREARARATTALHNLRDLLPNDRGLLLDFEAAQSEATVRAIDVVWRLAVRSRGSGA